MNTKGKIKVVFLGEQSTGKTSILTRFIQDKFEASLGATVGIDFMAKTVIVDQKVLRLQFWDTAGQQRFRSLIPNYLKQATIAFIVFDLSNEKSFANLTDWVDLCTQNMREKTVMILLANKQDLEERQVSQEEIKIKAEDFSLPYFQVSAKTGHKIKEALNFACEELLKQNKKKPVEKQEIKGNQSVRLNVPLTNQTNATEKKQKRCC